MPALYTDTGVDFVGKPAEYSKTEARRVHRTSDYHAPSDQVKPDWDLSGAVEDAQLMFMVGYRVANADKFPEWKPGNEFKAKRDADAEEMIDCVNYQVPSAKVESSRNQAREFAFGSSDLRAWSYRSLAGSSR